MILITRHDDNPPMKTCSHGFLVDHPERGSPHSHGLAGQLGASPFRNTRSLQLPSLLPSRLHLKSHQPSEGSTHKTQTTVFQHFTLQRAADPWDRETGTFMSLVIAAIDAWGLELIIEFHSQKYELATRCN